MTEAFSCHGRVIIVCLSSYEFSWLCFSPNCLL